MKRVLLVALLTLGLAIGLAAAPAQAVRSATSATVPGHTSDSSYMRLFGATDAGFVADQGESVGRVLAGVPGSTLSVLGQPSWSDLGAAGNYGWYHSGSEVHRFDLKTKADTTYSIPATAWLMGWAPDGWIDFEGTSIVRHVAGGATTTLVTGVDTTSGSTLPKAAADANGAVLIYDQIKAGTRDRYVALATWGKPLEIVWQQSAGAIYKLNLLDPAISPTTVDFTTLTSFNGGGQFVHQRPRAGGAITTTAIPADVSPFDVAAVGPAVAFTYETGTFGVDPSAVATFDGTTWRRFTLPGPRAMLLRSTGTKFAIGLSGKNASTAGVYTFGATGGITRAATLPALPAIPYGVTLSAGQLTYADDAVAGPYHSGSMWRRPVSGSTSVTLGAETRLSAATSLGVDYDTSAEMKFSSGRGIVRKPSATREFQLLARGAVTRTLPMPADSFYASYQISGPYAALAAKIYRADGSLVLDLSAENNGKLALFGKTLIYQSGANKIMLRDLEKPSAAPTTLATSGICDQFGNCANGIAAWYDTVAWQRLDNTIAVRTISTGATRIIDPGTPTPTLGLSDNALWWSDNRSTWAVDLGSATSTPVQLGDLRNGSVDSHLVAGVNGSGQVAVQTLPFASTRKTPVRLIGTLAPAAFTPGTWSPQFDLTKPASSVVLTIKSGTTTVRTLTGTAPDGSIRDLFWDGKNTTGTRVTPGTYTYQLTATATDDEGPLTPITGTIKVN